MSTIKEIEKLEVWQEAKKLGKMIYELANKLPKSEDYNLKRHLKENARGLPANIAEGFYRYSKKEKLHFYSIAKGCLGEIKNDVYFAFDIYLEIFKGKLLEEYFQQIDKVGKKLNKFIITTKNY